MTTDTLPDTLAAAHAEIIDLRILLDALAAAQHVGFAISFAHPEVDADGAGRCIYTVTGPAGSEPVMARLLGEVLRDIGFGADGG